MFHIIEKYRMPAQLLLGAIGISFIGFGLANFDISTDKNYIVRVGDQYITRDALEIAIRNSEQSGGVAERNQVFQILLNRAYLQEGAKRLGIVVSDAQIKQAVVDTPEFHDANGKFAPAKFQAFLQQTHLSEEQFMAQERERLTLTVLLNTLNQGTVSDEQAMQFVNARFAERTIRTSVFNPENYAKDVKIDDASLQKFYDANKQTYALQQGVKYDYIVLSPKDLLDKQTVSDAEVQAALKDAQANAKPTRKIAHILIEAPKSADEATRSKAKAQAEQVAKEAQAVPEKFADLAKQYSQDAGSAQSGGELGNFAKDGSLPAPALEEAAFKLGEGEVSGVVETDFGYHIVRVTDIQAIDVAALTERVRRELQEKKAQQAYNKMRDELSEAVFASNNDLAAAASKFGLTVQKQGEWLTRANAAELKVPTAVVDAALSDEIFSKRQTSDAISADGATWFVRPTETRAAGTEPLANVRERVQADWVRSESVRLAREAAQKAVEALRKGETPTLAWMPEQKVVPMQVQALILPQDYAQFIAAQPKNGKPAFAVVERGGMVELVEVKSIATLNDPKILNAIKAEIAQVRGSALAEAYIDGLRAQVPTEQGSQKIADE
ncbi:Peptidyl-prolyl cis-trans isomerase D [Kingella kingae]|uniref:peptidylprolyl isomerase n=1 Tax=Kingella kingae TaxID=504 RepID=UPI000DFE868E|nr:peptidylprolyl isomerase [Kingella kingae]MDK4595843.1 peptidylprolyl isomerase [Kingella kingae]MDK4599642.1 peptidylprolyl isomerase [Kingella kingae]MDK4653491.1 peptidylprolyl isomerase [Kingella kingae]QIP47212.1 peptidylprolyl isomerase [Kingella kingae]STR04140.1 Peptidyl-prolyl cis-trans isomerase D [Kingella kingae]